MMRIIKKDVWGRGKEILAEKTMMGMVHTADKNDVNVGCAFILLFLT